MKYYIKLFLILIFATTISSCSEEEFGPVVDGNDIPPILLELESGVNLDPDYASNPAMTLTWSYADYGLNVVPNYSILFSTDEAFTEPFEAAVTTSRTYTWTSQNLNKIALDDLGMAANETGNMYIKVVSSLGNYGAYEAASNVLMVSFTPYPSYNFNDWYLVGSAVAPGWNNNNGNPALFRDPENPDLYTYTGYFAGGGGNGFKLIQVLGQWAPMYGTNDGGATMTFRETESDPDPGIWTPEAGYYTYTFDIGNLTSTAVPFDAENSPTYSTIGLIGDATAGGWDSDTPMVQSSIDPHFWSLENVTLGGGGAKFRADSDWANNWGADTTYTGTGIPNGPNIPIISGTYNVYFTDLTGQYMFIPVQ